jgi:lysozyme family protein
MPFPLTDAVRQQYQQLFDTCVVNPAHLSGINQVIARIMPNQARYRAISDPLGVPWFFVALVHNLECGLRFDRHLHNGDPLTARTVQVPRGRPLVGNPPFTFEQSATDALRYQGYANVRDWSLPAVLYRLEGYNGYGYHSVNPPVNSPYLWSYSQHYTKGKYVADHVYDPNAVSTQCGSAVILAQMVKNGIVSFAAAATGAAAAARAPGAPAPGSK